MVSRGCIKDLPSNNYGQNEGHETLCLEDGCNDHAVSSDQYCYECDSKTDPKCVSRMDKSMLKLCPESEQNFRCFHMINGTYLLLVIVFYSKITLY